MREWLRAVADYPALSCDSCAEIEEQEGARPVCADGRCPKAAPDGPAGVAARLWSDLKAAGGSLTGAVVLEAYGLAPDRTAISLLRYLDKTASSVFSRKIIKMETGL